MLQPRNHEHCFRSIDVIELSNGVSCRAIFSQSGYGSSAPQKRMQRGFHLSGPLCLVGRGYSLIQRQYMTVYKCDW